MNRTLIVGLGSTGRDVVDNIIQRIEWSKGSLEETPWVEFLVMETEHLAGIASQRTDNYVGLDVPDNRFRSLIDTPGQFAEQLDLPRWLDRDVIPAGIDFSKGAGNVRMAGRLAFLEPTSFTQAKAAVADRLRALAAVTDAEVNAKIPQMNGAITLDPKTRVVVMGTVCGGTASGSFLDVAYMIRDVATDRGYTADLYGIFTLPPLANPSERFRANAFAALQEWNHYLTSGTTARVRFPDKNGDDKFFHVGPFNRSYLVQPKTDNAREQLNDEIADYVFGMATTTDFAQVDGKVSNTENFMRGVDRIGASRQWATFSIRTVEYPADLVARGCCLRVAGDALDALLAPATAETPLPLLQRLRLDKAGMENRLKLQQILNEVAAAMVERMEQVQQQHFLQVDALADPRVVVSAAITGLEKGYIDARLRAETDALMGALQPLLAHSAELNDPSLPLATVDKRLAELDTQARAELEAIRRTNKEGLTLYAANRKAVYDEFLNLQSSQLEVRTGCLGGLLGQRAQAEREARQERTQKERALLTQYIARVGEENLSVNHRARLYEELAKVIAFLRVRLMGDDKALKPGIHGYLLEMRERIAEDKRRVDAGITAATSPFTLPPSIDTEYQESLRRHATTGRSHADVERQWREAARARLDLLPRELEPRHGASEFDKPAQKPQLRLTTRAGLDGVLSHLRGEFVWIIDRPLGDTLQNVPDAFAWLTAGASLLDLNPDAPTQLGVQPQQEFSLLFYDEVAMGNSGSAATRVAFDAGVARLKAGDNFVTVNTVDRHRVTFVSEFAAFSLNAVNGCQEAVGADQFRTAFRVLSERPKENPASRADVFWTPIARGDFETFRRSRQMFLVGLASGLIATVRVGLYQFDCPQQRALSLQFDSIQWNDNAAQLFRKSQSRSLLEIWTEDWYRAVHAEGVVSAVRTYAEQRLTSLAALKDGEQPLTPQQFNQACYQFFENYADVRQEFLRVDPDIDATRRYRRAKGEPLPNTGQPAPEEGYYCLQSGHLVGKDRLAVYNPCPACTDKLLTGQELI